MWSNAVSAALLLSAFLITLGKASSIHNLLEKYLLHDDVHSLEQLIDAGPQLTTDDRTLLHAVAHGRKSVRRIVTL